MWQIRFLPLASKTAGRGNFWFHALILFTLDWRWMHLAWIKEESQMSSWLFPGSKTKLHEIKCRDTLHGNEFATCLGLTEVKISHCSEHGIWKGLSQMFTSLTMCRHEVSCCPPQKKPPILMNIITKQTLTDSLCKQANLLCLFKSKSTKFSCAYSQESTHCITAQ